MKILVIIGIAVAGVVFAIVIERGLDLKAVDDAEILRLRATERWELDPSDYLSIGITSSKNSIVVRSWQRKSGSSEEQIDVTPAESVACRWRRTSEQADIEDLGCVQLE